MLTGLNSMSLELPMLKNPNKVLVKLAKMLWIKQHLVRLLDS
jgi:hypothetical protein